MITSAVGRIASISSKAAILSLDISYRISYCRNRVSSASSIAALERRRTGILHFTTVAISILLRPHCSLRL